MYTIYTKNNCSYCVKAKQLFKSKNIEYVEKNIEILDYRLELLNKYPEAKTVPQIFVNNSRVGGYDELVNFFNQTL